MYKSVLITGGTGTFGTSFIKKSLTHDWYKKITIFSRDEFKQHNLKNELLNLFPSDVINEKLRFFIGDVRDKDRLLYATKNQDIVLHAAALKHVHLCEYNPQEAIKTNIFGTQNLVEACIENNVKRVVCLSTDKSVNPINLYGATKLCLEKIALNHNYLSTVDGTKISVVRYGNVIASRGSVIPTLLECNKNKSDFTLTSPEMTRFWLTIDDAINLVMFAIDKMQGMEIYVPKMKSLSMQKLVQYLAPQANVKIVGLRPGEKIHEMMISSHEINRTYVASDKIYVILPEHFPGITRENNVNYSKVDFSRYTSDSVEEFSDVDFIKLIEDAR